MTESEQKEWMPNTQTNVFFNNDSRQYLGGMHLEV